MKTPSLLAIIFLLLFSSAYAQSSSLPKLEISTPVDFGALNQGEQKILEIPCKNTGSVPLEINQVIISSGNVKVLTTNLKVAPGKTGLVRIEINYDYHWSDEYPPDGDQRFSKTLMIRTNEPEDVSAHMIRITGTFKEPVILE